MRTLLKDVAVGEEANSPANEDAIDLSSVFSPSFFGELRRPQPFWQARAKRSDGLAIVMAEVEQKQGDGQFDAWIRHRVVTG